MNILLTGQNSFTGLILCKKLLSKGFNIYSLTSSDSKKLNATQNKLLCSIEQNKNYHPLKCNYKEKDVETIKSIDKNIDIFIMHGYNVLNYKSTKLNPIDIANDSTQWLINFPNYLKDIGCKTVAFTGTYFENFSNNLQTPYSISKKISWNIIQSFFKDYSLINYLFPNPFGVGESKKFANYIISSLKKNETISINTPYQIRDNIPVDFLIDDYISSILGAYSLPKKSITKKSPSYFVESNYEFASKISEKVKLILPDFKPIIKINYDSGSDFVSGKESIRSKYIHKEDYFWKKYIKSYF